MTVGGQSPPNSSARLPLRCHYNLVMPSGRLLHISLQAHIWMPWDRAEYLWVEQNVMKDDAWYWLGLWCAPKPTKNMNTFYTLSGEDTTQIQKNMKVEFKDEAGDLGWRVLRTHRYAVTVYCFLHLSLFLHIAYAFIHFYIAYLFFIK